ncbi:MAG: FKBP-type peptidyl-prolyl cis-trans isomerase [Bacteroidetes bacterium]|jgi:FKBP-type peptidyl-prolyl cis-trans isomerase|nr:FKBP-type peptidyl-prolyl cis-trans isomerase [Bacteroidota bacterium]MBT5531397.1 FKBP-type peptidyl-prolyl cis-trans isomerase [Cytophagia bacterium]MBT3424443.1 FKBP-type peptidyl-prolyl cis-trans isomerase [Bacteroidota bacterium]MBT3802906.1 FKBP-type peptidyl-prolyl cis-trans isomerase [Bacteroidota bacterium]MBT3932858.1 FKBP-type peptidyl-prolyl cis-trans isomerase [Bacteroidota bacterium]
MKKLTYLLSLVILVLFVFTSCKDGLKFGSKDFEPENNVDSISYSIGMDIAKNFIEQEYEINADAMAAGYKEYIEENAFFTDEEKDAVLMAWQQEMQLKSSQKQQEKALIDAEPNKKLGAEFMAENKKKEGVMETQSGLQYKVIREGSGAKPMATDVVTIHYRGKLLDGTIFDESYNRNEPLVTPLNRVVPGWTEGVMLMSPGAKYELYIPSDLAYGDQGAGEVIPPGATLIFEVELISFETLDAPAQ